MNAKLGSTETLEITFFLLISSDLCHKKMLLESLNIPLSSCKVKPLPLFIRIDYGKFSLRLIGSAMFGATFKLVKSVGVP